MPKALTIEERFRRAKEARSAARSIANQVTKDTPGRERASLIIRVRSQYNHAYTAVGRIANGRHPEATPVDRNRALTILADCERALSKARRFST